jgi:SAM-dependent methyltransferase
LKLKKEKMQSRELGLVLGQQLLGVDDLHYGLWDDDLELKITNLAQAQQRYTELLLSNFPDPKDNVRVVDIGCGTGHILSQLLGRGYHVDGVIPSKSLSKLVNQRLEKHPGHDTQLFECKFEDFPASQFEQRYDVALFSESFQYIPMDASFSILQRILKPGGLLVICDFFKTEHHGDGQPGDRSFGGGHPMDEFYEKVKQTPFSLLRDEDITRRVSPNLALLNDLLQNTIKPVGITLGQYLHSNYPKLSWIATKLFRKKFNKLNYKYFSGHRSKEVFERYKTYHLLVYKLNQ